MEATTDRERTRLCMALYHSLLYPRSFSEYGRYYSAFDDQVHLGESYTAYSTWDIFRAEKSLLTLFAPERIDGMITALLKNFREGWMPKWPNPSYTNIMIGTPAPTRWSRKQSQRLSGLSGFVCAFLRSGRVEVGGKASLLRSDTGVSRACILPNSTF